MAFTKEQLRSVKIYNEYGYANKNPYITYRTQDNGRGGHCAAWMICYPGHSFKNVPFYDYGNLAFNVFDPKKDKASELLKAQEKFKELYQVTELVKTPFGGWMSKEFVEARNKEIKEMLKNSK
jgi:hypothetical protein